MANLSLFLLLFLPVVSTQTTLEPTFSEVLDNDGKYLLSWNFNDDVIVMEMHVETTGYIGLGLSPNGGMEGSDIIIVGVDDVTNKPYLHDLHGIGTTEPVEDDHADWNITSFRQNGTHTVVRVSRKLDTCDEQDRAIKVGTQRVIWAYHLMDWSQAAYKYHGRENRGAKSVFLLNPQKVVSEIPSDSYTIEFLNPKIQVPSNDTTYWCEAFNMPTFDTKHHIIKFEPIIQPGNEAVVHHIVLSTCPQNFDNSSAGTGESCFPNNRWLGCATSLYGWAVGGGPFYLPDHVGFPVGIDDDPKVIILQTHFDNPLRRSDIVDSSGIRMTVTSRLRRHDAGMLLTGPLLWETTFIPPHAEKYRLDGHCFAGCLEEGFGNETSINVFAAFLHAHLLSTAIRLRHFRKGVEQRPISADESYDFDFQETRLLTTESRVLAGDNLVTECDYRSVHKDKMTFAGEATYDEMCVVFVMYYPRVPITNCYSMQPVHRLADIAGVKTYGPVNGTVKSPPEYQGLRVQEVLAKHVDWRDEKNIARAQKETTSYDNPVTAICFHDYQNFYFRVGGAYLRPPAIKSTYHEPTDCRVNGGDRRHPLRDVTALALICFISLIV